MLGGILARLVPRGDGDRGLIDDGSRALASEYAGMLEQAGIPVRSHDGENAAGYGFMLLTDARFGEILCAISGTPDEEKGYLVVPAPDDQPEPGAGDDLKHVFTWPGRNSFAGRRILEATLDLLAGSGLYEPEPEEG